MLELLPYQQSLVSDEARFTWNCWARQTGKSTTLGLRRLMRAVERKRLQVILSAGERQSREVMEKIRHHCRSLSIYYEWCEESYFKGDAVSPIGASAFRGREDHRVAGESDDCAGFFG